jgi:hypothetical protein
MSMGDKRKCPDSRDMEWGPPIGMFCLNSLDLKEASYKLKYQS